MRTRYSLRRWDMRTGRTQSVEFFVRATEGKAGRKFCFTMKIRGRLTWHSNRGTRKQFMRRCGRRGGRRGAFIRLRMDRGADSTARKMAATIGSRLRGMGCLPKGWGESELPLRRAVRGGFT